MKIILQILLFVSLISCNGYVNQCSNKYDNEIPKTIDEELNFAKEQIIENIDSLQKWNVINKKLIGQEAGILANINLGLWNLIDGAYLESITIKSENLILFEYYTNSCTYKEEYIVFNGSNMEEIKIFKNSKIRVDSIKANWNLIRVKKELETEK